jgi:signal transduction histidine kinase
MVEHDFESIGPRRILLNAQTLLSVHDEQPMILLAFEDITERAQAEAALRESGERFRTLFDLVPVAVYYCDASGVIQNFNHRAEELWGRTPESGDTDERFCGSFKMFRPDGTFMPHEQCPMAEVVSGKILEVNDQEVLIERPDGSRITAVVNIRPLKNQFGEGTGAVNCFYDISDRKLAEAALIKSEKLAAAGRLAATLAHEINNPLQAVTNLVTLLKQSPKLDTQDRSFATLAAEELDRVAHLTQQSLSFYRESSHPTSVNLEIVFDSVLDLYAKRLLAKEMIVTRDYVLDGAMINSYPGEIRQVLSTLLLNAIEAVPAGGTIALRIHRSFDGNNPVSDGVRMTIADSGIGIPPNNVARIFEPFFTTKGEQGTGLGLWVANGIISRLGGSIHVRSSVRAGKSGTCFSLFLPTQLPGRA